MGELVIELDREADDRWYAEIPAVPGCLAYGVTREEAIANVKACALRHLSYPEKGPTLQFRVVEPSVVEGRTRVDR